VYKIPIGLPLKEVKEGSRSNSVARDRAKHSELGMGFLSLPESPAGLLGLGSLSWAGHQVHLSLPINQFLNAGVDPKEIPLPHESRSFGSTLSQFAEGFHGQNMRNSWRIRSCNWGSVADWYCPSPWRYCISFSRCYRTNFGNSMKDLWNPW